ncbi:hypothetical protein ACIRU3_45770 [Streptomyces sp. NPDC101151]|uniref:hypothetical protein n=1 Tax=Streptomyces sp. NPDC101151 TaxID=3366115 RepID=UPI0037FCAEE6
MVQDMHGLQVTFKAEAELPKGIKAGIDISYQYQRTVATISATSTMDAKNLGVDPGKAGYLVFQPLAVRATGTLFALYPKYTNGLNGWFSGTGSDGPSRSQITSTNPLLTPDGEADGQWYIQDVPCSTLP